LGPAGFKKLLERFERIVNIFDAKRCDLEQVVSPQIAKGITSKRIILNANLYTKKLKKLGISFHTILDEKYPKLLKNIHDPPLILYYIGSLRQVDFARCFSVVGTRNCTDYGRQVTQEIVQGLVEVGFVIVSGMAFGIDKCSHESALKSGGRTIAVLSSRVDVPTPRTNRDIYQAILKNGGIVSEAHLDQEFNPGLFPLRNRIISALSRGTLVVEAGDRSGALITAYQALEQGREVFAVPANTYTSKGVGTNKLIKRGEAKLVQGVGDILEEFGFSLDQKKSRKNYTPEERKIVDSIVDGNTSANEIAQELKMDISELTQILSVMEIEGKVVKGAGNRYIIVK